MAFPPQGVASALRGPFPLRACSQPIPRSGLQIDISTMADVLMRYVPLEFWYATRNPPTKPSNPPRRRTVRWRTLCSGSAMSIRRHSSAKVSQTRRYSCTPEIQERRECSCPCSPCCIVRRTEVANDARKVGVCVDDRVGCLHCLVGHGLWRN